MGYHTSFQGQFNLDKPLTVKQYNELKKYNVEDHGHEQGTPGAWCGWIPTEDGMGIAWDYREKFYDYTEWLGYLIEHFFKPWGYVVNGEVMWQGEDVGDMGTIYVKDNVVTAQKYERNPEIPICEVCSYSYDIREPHRH